MIFCINQPSYHTQNNFLFNDSVRRNILVGRPEATDEEVIEAAKASGATVILPGNVYVFGNHPGIFDTTTPHRATTKKGRIRMDLEAAYRAAAKDGVQTINLRAGDLIDPASEDGTNRALRFGVSISGSRGNMGRMMRW